MRKLLFAAFLLLPAVAPVAAPHALAEDLPARRIIVTGSAQVSAAPDVATISGGVETEAATAAEALRENSEAMRQILDALAGLGIAEADIQTTRLSLDPVWDQSEDRDVPRVTGYRAGNMVTIIARQTGQLGAVIDAMGSGGANRIHGIGFDMADPRAQLARAREEAVADARAKAETLARSAGVELGEVLTIDETRSTGGGPIPMHARMESAAPIASGSVDVRSEVTITYALR